MNRIEKWKWVFLSFFFGFGIILQAQSFNLTYFKNVIDTLSSPSFAGRGYIDDGMEKAGIYIRDEFKRNGLKSFTSNYAQPFTFPIHIIEDAQLTINGQSLHYGIDFIVKPSSHSISKSNLPFYKFDTNAYVESFQSKGKTKDFILKDHQLQQGHHIVLPPLKTTVDSIQRYYKQWANIYGKDEKQNQAIFRFTSDKLISSLSQRSSSVSEFIISDKFYSNQFQIDDFLIQANFNQAFKASNYIGYVEGKNNDSVVVISAHYDHLGKVGQTIFPGASDNASGTAMLLSLMKHYVKYPPKHKTVFMVFAAEEAGILGAQYYVDHPLFPLEKIKFLVNLDILGSGEDGIQVVNGKIFRKEFEQLVKLNQKKQALKQIKTRGESCNSDHCPFYQHGVPSFFIYTLGGKGFYHDPNDTAENLDLSYSEKVFNLLQNFISSL